MNVLNITILAEVVFSYIPNAREMSVYNILLSINNPILERITYIVFPIWNLKELIKEFQNQL